MIPTSNEVEVTPSVAIVILCAGRSSRAGGPQTHKLFSRFQGITLLRRSAVIATQSNAASVFVVTGGLHDKMELELAGIEVNFVRNPYWESGIASSIKAGWDASYKCGYDGIMIMLADMPLITIEDLDVLIATFVACDGASIVRASHHAKPGNPVIFPRTLNFGIMKLEGDVGARGLVSGSSLGLIDVELGLGAILDVDTDEQIRHVGGTPATCLIT